MDQFIDWRFFPFLFPPSFSFSFLIFNKTKQNKTKQNKTKTKTVSQKPPQQQPLPFSSCPPSPPSPRKKKLPLAHSTPCLIQEGEEEREKERKEKERERREKERKEREGGEGGGGEVGGYLMKQGVGMGTKAWKKRYFLLVGESLVYYSGFLFYFLFFIF